MSDSPDRYSISLHSFSSALIITPKSSILSGQSTDEFELIVDSDVEVSDDRGDEEGYDGGRNSMSSASVSPSIYAHEFEHCRRYHSYKSGRYPLPNDIPEQRREETLHYLALEMNEGHAFLSEVVEWPQKIIDIGTGIGSWAIEVADLYPGASVKGTDLSPIQPNWLPVNLRMFVEDCEGEWLHGSGFDLIHMRDVIGTLRDIPSMLEKIHNNLTPGGWVEFQDIETSIYCDDMTMSSNDPLSTFFKFATKGIQSFGLTAYPLLPNTLTPLLSQTGFTNIQVITKKIPIAPWTRDPNLAAAGVLAKEWVSETIDAMAAKPLATLDMTVKDRKELAGQAKRSLEKEEVHRYLKMHVVLAQREREMSVVSDSESYMSLGSA